MIPSNAYRKQQNTGWTRIDLVLALFDGAIERLDRALEALKAGDSATAWPLQGRVQTIVMQLMAGINLDVGDPNSINLMRLYEFCTHHLSQQDIPKLESVRRVLDTLREGFRAIRDEAVNLERTGAIPPADSIRLLATVG